MIRATPSAAKSGKPFRERIAEEDAKRKAREAREEAESLAEYERERAKEAGNGLTSQS